MKTRTLLAATIAATLALAGCSKNDEPDGPTLPEGAVNITASIGGTADGSNTGGDIETRAPQLDTDGSGSFQTGDAWGMYTTIGGTTGDNTEYKYQETVLLWKDLSETAPVTFSAHYPRITATVADPAAYVYTPVAADNTDDLLHATAIASKGEAVALAFKHLMHRLIVNLTAGEGMTGTDLSSTLINSLTSDNKLTMCGSVEVNLLTGDVNYGYTGTKVSLSNGGEGNADWKVAPQDLTPGAEWLRIAVGEDVWYYNVPADLNTTEPGNQTRLESGKQLTLNLTLKKNQQTGDTEVELTSSAIAAWDTQGEINDDINIGGDEPAPTVYMSGVYQADPTDIMTYRGAYWINGARTNLALPADATGNNYANGIAVSDGKVYVSGQYNDGTIAHLGYWTDNTLTGLEVAVEAADNLTNGIAAAGGTVYTVGYCKAADGKKYGYCWEDATRKELRPDGATSSYANAVTVSGGKAYISGTYNASGQKNCYWADGTFIPLDQPTDASNASAGDITVSGGKVYCLGTYTSGGNDYTCYWADGTRTELTEPADAEMGIDAFGIAADGGNVYVVGKVWASISPYVQYACLWTDNVPAALPVPEGVTYSIARYVTVHDGKVCVAGAYVKDGKPYTCYWIDGTRGGDTVTELPDGAGEINYPSAGMTLVW